MPAVQRTRPPLSVSLRDSRPTTVRQIGSWAASLTIHALLLWGAFSLADLWHTESVGTVVDDSREVGIYVKPASTAESSDTAESQAEPTVSEAVEAMAAESAVPDQPPVELQIPTADQDVPLAGLGAAPSQAGGSFPNAMPLKSNGLPRRPDAARNEAGSAQFFGAEARGTRFVYVIDASGSMAKHNAIGAAKTELLASLQSLDRTQKFQVIFYNQKISVFSPQRQTEPQLYWATDLYRTQARQFIAGATADLGTDHMPAVRQALRLEPEAVFLLTDADEPILTGADLDEIQRLSGGKTQFHCIEFGRGPALTIDNFLKRLSRMTGGTYRYVDVTRLARGRALRTRG